MNRIFYPGIFVFFLGFSALMPQEEAGAQTYPAHTTQEQKPQPTAPGYTAMFFDKLAGRLPDFESMARDTPAYKNAASPDKLAVQDQQVRELKSIYSLLTMQEPMIVEMPVKLSAYSTSNKGFFVTNFKEDTFFPVRYNSQSYAIVPKGLMDRQWLEVHDASAARAIEAASANKNGKPLTMTLTLAPKYADSSSPAKMDDENYWLMSAEIKKMALYSPDSSSPLWQSDHDKADDAMRQKILKLRQ